MEDGKVSKLYVLAPILAALLDSAFQSGTLPDAVKSSLITPVFKKGDKFDPSNYRPIAVGEPLCRLYAAILNSRIVNWAESNGLRAPCQAGFRPQNTSCSPCVISLTGPNLRSSPYLQLLWTSKRPMIACNTHCCGLRCSARAFMARCWLASSLCMMAEK